VTFVVYFFSFVHSRFKKTRQPLTHKCSKRVKSAKDVPFGSFVRNFHRIPIYPNSNFVNLHYKSRYSLKTRINLNGSAIRIRSRVGNNQWELQISGWKFDRK